MTDFSPYLPISITPTPTTTITGALKLMQNLTLYLYALLMIAWLAGEVFEFMVVGVEHTGKHPLPFPYLCIKPTPLYTTYTY
jgi:hypothetical protein